MTYSLEVQDAFRHVADYYTWNGLELSKFDEAYEHLKKVTANIPQVKKLVDKLDLFKYWPRPTPEYDAALVKQAGYTDKNFEAALESGAEILINGPYYAVSVNSLPGKELAKLITGVEWRR
jgi:hypothetical protein